MATVMAQGKQLEEPTSKTLGVLVPITGTDVSRRAAEIAFSLGKGATVTALYVEQKSGRSQAMEDRADVRHEQF